MLYFEYISPIGVVDYGGESQVFALLWKVSLICFKWSLQSWMCWVNIQCLVKNFHSRFYPTNFHTFLICGLQNVGLLKLCHDNCTWIIYFTNANSIAWNSFFWCPGWNMQSFSPFLVGGEFVLELFQIAILSFLNMHHQAWNSQTLLLF